MPTILQRLPFYETATTLRIPNGPAIEIGHDQIVLWVSIASKLQQELPSSSQRFPALLDLGFNGYFLLREDHIANWMKTKLDEARFPFLRALTLHGENVSSFEANVWVHGNIPGFRDQLAEVPPFRLEMIGGVIVCPASMARYHLPLLGVSALRKNRLRLLVNGERRYISLRAPFTQT